MNRSRARSQGRRGRNKESPLARGEGVAYALPEFGWSIRGSRAWEDRMRRIGFSRTGIWTIALAILGALAIGHARPSDAAALAASRAAQNAKTAEKPIAKASATENSESKPLSTRVVAYQIAA